MKKHSRRFWSQHGTQVSGERGKGQVRKAKDRRPLQAERLEGRSLLAADVNPFHNELFPTDVDNDVYLSPRDALMVINDLNTYGSRSLLASSGTPVGELPQAAPFMVDVNGDGFVSPQDALGIINQLNGEGEGTSVQFGFTTLSLTGTAISSVQVGDHFRLRTNVQDIRALPSGVFAGYLDVAFTTNLQPVIRENQRIQVTGNPDDGSFTLTFSGQTTAPITFDPQNNTPTAGQIRLALEALSNIDPGEIEVFNGPNVGTSWDVKFGGKRYGDTNVVNMTGAGTFNGGTSPGVTITEFPGSSPVAGENDTIVRSTSYGTNYPNSPSARNGEGSDLNVLNEIGGIAGLTPLGGGNQLLFTYEFKATGSGTGTFTANPAEDSPSHDVLLFGSSTTVPDAEIVYPSVNISITQAANAVNDSATATEDQTTATRVDVLANDTILAGTKTIVSFTQPANGNVTRFTNGNTNPADDQLDFIPAANFFGQTTFTYVLSDGGANTSTATVTITVSGVNDAPTIAGPTSVSTNEDTTVAFTGGNTVSVADIDAQSGNVTVTLNSSGALNVDGSFAGLISSGSNGSATFALTGTVTQVNSALATLTFLPALNFNGSTQITATVNDNGNTGSGGAKTASRTMTVSVTAVNDAPVNSVPGAQSVTEGTTLVFSSANANAITTNDVDVGANPVQINLGVTQGKLTLPNLAGLTNVTGNGTNAVSFRGTLTAVNAALNGLSYVPNDLFIGEDTLTITTSDLGSSPLPVITDTDSVTINVIPNIRPRAINDSATVDEDSSNNLITVIGNDIPNAGATITLLSVADGSKGTTEIVSGQISYTPNGNEFGTDTFTYVINDSSGQGADSTGTVTVTIREINDAPIPVNDSRDATEDIPLTIGGATLASNDSPGPNESSQSLTVTAVSSTSAQGGTVTLSGGNVIYTPASNFNGTDTFTYTVTDNGTTFGVAAPQSATGTVTVTVAAVNDNPIAGNNSVTGVEDTAVTVNFSTLLANDSPGGGTDEAGQTLSVQSVAATSSIGGTVTTDATSLVFTPPDDFNGVATITYVVQDDGSPVGTATGTLTITLSEVNDDPTANPDSLSAVKNVTKVISAASLLGNDSKGPANESDQTLRITSVTSPSARGGTVVLNGDGSVSYTPPAEAIGDDSFTYTMSDDGTTNGSPANLTSSALVTINILDFIPMTFSGAVYFDLNNDGLRQDNEPGMGGVEVVLEGEDFEGNAVGPLEATTDRDGHYEFLELAPGDYHVFQKSQPANTVDGLEHSGTTTVEVDGNDRFMFDVTVEENVELPSQVLGNNNFGERGVSSAFASVFALLASSANEGAELPQGILFSYSSSDGLDPDWFHFLDGWNSFLSADLDLAADHQSAVLTVVNGASQTLQTTISVSSGRLRVRTDATGAVVVHVVGNPSDFTLAQAGGEGEGEGEAPEVESAVMVAAAARGGQSTADVVRTVDAVLASGESWT